MTRGQVGKPKPKLSLTPWRPTMMREPAASRILAGALWRRLQYSQGSVCLTRRVGEVLFFFLARSGLARPERSFASTSGRNG